MKYIYNLFFTSFLQQTPFNVCCVLGDFHPGDLPSNLQTRPNLSHVVIDGGTLHNWKTFSRANGFSSPFVNGTILNIIMPCFDKIFKDLG